MSAAAGQVADMVDRHRVLLDRDHTLRVARESPRCPILGSDCIGGDRAPHVGDLGGASAGGVADPLMTEMVGRAVRAAQHEGFAKAGDVVVVTAGLPFGAPGPSADFTQQRRSLCAIS